VLVFVLCEWSWRTGGGRILGFLFAPVDLLSRLVRQRRQRHEDRTLGLATLPPALVVIAGRCPRSPRGVTPPPSAHPSLHFLFAAGCAVGLTKPAIAEHHLKLLDTVETLV
jgi:hypothetical protein